MTLPKNKETERPLIAGVILAAGESRRFGQVKQLLDFHGKTFIENIVEAALAAGLSPVAVVLGAHQTEIAPILGQYGDTINIVKNPDWQTGQSASIRIAVNLLKNRCNAAIFLLVDQPQVKPALLQALSERYIQTDATIVVPFVGERRGNPVLFDERCFPRLQELQGDQGGRQLFADFPQDRLDWPDAGILLDVDSPQDYQELLNEFGKLRHE